MDAMRFLPTRIHGAIDYAWGALLIIAPLVFAGGANNPATWISVAFGVGAILYSVMTDYELGVFRVVSVPVHLILDGVAGLALVLVAYAFIPDPAPKWTLVAFGAFAMVASLITEQRPRSTRGQRLA